MKILLISYFYGENASGVISKRVAMQLTKHGHNVVVLTHSKMEEKEGDSRIKIETVKDPWNQGDVFSRITQRLKRTNIIYLYEWLWVNKAKKVSRKIIDSFKPDIVYCRTSPEDACYVGYYIQKKYHIPTIQHFSDPVPPPLEYLPDTYKRACLTKKISKVIKKATLVSYGNEAMLNYVRGVVNIDFGSKAFVSPDMASGSTLMYSSARAKRPTVLLFFGSLYGGRNPYPLLEAVNELIGQGYEIEFQIYSTVSKEVLVDYPFVSNMDYNPNTFDALSNADVLIDLDGDDEIPVFISSKLKDYLLINRPIVSITPNGSPSRKLLEEKESIRVVNNVKEQIESAIKSFMEFPIENNQYLERTPLITYFSPESVVEGLIEEMEKCVNC